MNGNPRDSLARREAAPTRRGFLGGAVASATAASLALPSPSLAKGALPGSYCLPLKKNVPFDFELELLDADGQLFHVTDFGGHPVWLVFFASWCGPCNDEAADIADIARTYRGAGLRVAGIDVAEQEGPVRDFVKRHKIEYPVALDRDGSVFHQLTFSAFPTHLFLDKDGYTTCVVAGGLERRDMDNEVAVALAHKQRRR